MLEYVREAVAELVTHDTLLVLGRGLGAFEVLARFLTLHSHATSFVVLLNAPKHVQARLELLLRAQGCALAPRAINNEYSSDERAKVYSDGGVVAVTTRILTVDLLQDKIPAEKLSGIVVWDAHRVTDTTNEAFVLRLFRQKNKAGFVKGISDQPDAFQGGFSKVEKVMKALFVTKLNLWPRFHVTVLLSSLLLSRLVLRDTQVYEPLIRVRLGTAAHLCQVVVLKLRIAGAGVAGAAPRGSRRDADRHEPRHLLPHTLNPQPQTQTQTHQTKPRKAN